MMQTDSNIERIAAELDLATVTVVVAKAADERHFVAESLVIAAALFLLEEYASGVLEGLGLHEKAKSHAKAAQAWLLKVRSKPPSDDELTWQKQYAGTVLRDIAPHLASTDGITAGEAAVHSYLRSTGATESQSSHVGKIITNTLKKTSMEPYIPRSPEQGLFLNLTMLLMFHHPMIGAESFAIYRGESHQYKLGWNHNPGVPGALRESWIFIGPDHGHLHWTRPRDISGEVNELNVSAPPLKSTSAWRFLYRQGIAAGTDSREYALAKLVESTDERESYPRDEDDVTFALRSALREMQMAAKTCGSGEEMMAPLRELILSFLRFESSGHITARILSGLLLNAGAFVSPPQDGYDTFMDLQLSIRDYLGDMVWRLLHERRGMQPGSCEYMTYLAALYAQTIIYHSDLLRVGIELDSQRLDIVTRLDQNVDELLCHDAFPFFVFFSMPTYERFIRADRQPYWQPFLKLHGKSTSDPESLPTQYHPLSKSMIDNMWNVLQRLRK